MTEPLPDTWAVGGSRVMRHICAPVADPSFWDRAAPSAVGALIGLVGLFTAWWLTQRATEQRETRKQAADSVAVVVAAGEPFRKGNVGSLAEAAEYAAAARRFGGTLTLFAAHQIRPYPKVAGVALEHADAMELWALQLLAATTSRRIRGISADLTQISGDLVDSLMVWLADPKKHGLPEVRVP